MLELVKTPLFCDLEHYFDTPIMDLADEGFVDNGDEYTVVMDVNPNYPSDSHKIYVDEKNVIFESCYEDKHGKEYRKVSLSIPVDADTDTLSARQVKGENKITISIKKK